MKSFKSFMPSKHEKDLDVIMSMVTRGAREIAIVKELRKMLDKL